jgi:DnaJ-class molecular chaperone
LKSLYREVAKRIHPDLSSDPEDRMKRQQLMAEANEAYQMGDFARLKRILEEYESSPEAVPGEGVGAELVRVIRKITQVRRRLSEIEQEIQKLTASDLAKLKVKTEESARRGRDLLMEMAEQVDRQIAAARQQASRMST